LTDRSSREVSWIAIGAVRGPHGIHGAVKVHSFSGETGHFRALTEVELRHGEHRQRMAIRSVTVQHRTPVLQFAGVETPEAARRWSGYEIRVPRDQAAPLATDEYYVDDLVGMDLVAGNTAVAVVTAVCDGAQAPLLEVRRLGDAGPEGPTLLVPFMDRFVGPVDPEKRRIPLEAPWVLDTE
jgi:16S rRNA processing protein RimM